ncbi:hypothetical protein H6P81_007222 [Aristolochia fimbriata]|uniref:Secreted protein n=1 Tax=Aristolochia fimbriata TaxID=158543 RepID=A0AAV7EZV9_ARIFI|nr:hypothetical protein H6P81_007222 [Aristolochia fimbriata]
MDRPTVWLRWSWVTASGGLPGNAELSAYTYPVVSDIARRSQVPQRRILISSTRTRNNNSLQACNSRKRRSCVNSLDCVSVYKQAFLYLAQYSSTLRRVVDN